MTLPSALYLLWVWACLPAQESDRRLRWNGGGSSSFLPPFFPPSFPFLAGRAAQPDRPAAARHGVDCGRGGTSPVGLPH